MSAKLIALVVLLSSVHVCESMRWIQGSCQIGSDKAVVQSIVIVCESIDAADVVQKVAYLRPTLDQETRGVHCGVVVTARFPRKHMLPEDLLVFQRYDLGPNFNIAKPSTYVTPLAVAISCSEGKHLRGYSDNKHRDQETLIKGNPHNKFLTLLALRKFIENNQIVSGNYDLHGGNCQHFAILLFQWVTGKVDPDLHPPNDDVLPHAIAIIARQSIPFLPKSAQDKLATATESIVNHVLDKISALYQKEGGSFLAKPEDGIRAGLPTNFKDAFAATNINGLEQDISLLIAGLESKE